VAEHDLLVALAVQRLVEVVDLGGAHVGVPVRCEGPDGLRRHAATLGRAPAGSTCGPGTTGL